MKDETGYVDMRKANDIQNLSGRAHAGSFLLTSASSTGTLQIGTVDGVKGILASDQAGTPTFYPVEITLIDPPATQTTTAASAPSVTPTLTQAADATVEGSLVDIIGPAIATATLGNVTAHGTLGFSGWKLVQLTGTTQFDGLQFATGSTRP